MTENQIIVHILGAGVDKPLGLPLANELMREVANFANSDGKAIATALRAQLPRLRFSFDKYTGEQGENVAERILMADPPILDIVQNLLTDSLDGQGEETEVHIQAVKTVVENLVEIRNKNQLDDQTLGALAAIGGEAYQPGGGDFILNPKEIRLTPIVRQAFRKTFQGLAQNEELSEDARETLTKIAQAMMNVEELLGTLFAGFYTRNLSHQKQYLYVAWLFWAYLRVKMEESLHVEHNSLYGQLGLLSEKHRFITLNYTSKFFPESAKKRVSFFHGNCMSYIRLDTRELIQNDQKMLEATSLESIESFLKSLEMNIVEGKVFLPGIVPPLSLKPVICREHLETWYNCGKLIDDAAAIVITGYSFNLADEHLNDLLRKRHGTTDTKIIVINPDLEGTLTNVCKLLGQNSGQLTRITVKDFECKQARNLTFVNAKSEELSPEVLSSLLDGLEI